MIQWISVSLIERTGKCRIACLQEGCRKTKTPYIAQRTERVWIITDPQLVENPVLQTEYPFIRFFVFSVQILTIPFPQYFHIINLEIAEANFNQPDGGIQFDLDWANKASWFFNERVLN